MNEADRWRFGKTSVFSNPLGGGNPRQEIHDMSEEL
jgi:hypothetical protein